MIKGIGVDSIELERVAGVYERYGERFLQKVYTAAERDYFRRWADPVPRIAGRFAVKEACMKALGTGWSGGVRWRDIEVLREPSGKPAVRLHGQAARALAALDADAIHCTITHSRDHAIALVILESTG
jgi:holo-[acyl-carrier protein] synthase